MKRKITAHVMISFLFLAAGLCFGQSAGVQCTNGIPEAFQTLYDELESKLDELSAAVDARWDGVKRPVAFATELLAASTNRGEVILEPQVFEAVKFNLDYFLDLGVTAVSFDIKYPALVPTFPRYEEYLEFYRKVTEEVRKRGFTLLIAMQIVFTDSIFGHLDVDFTGLTLEQYKAEKRQYAQTIINEYHPDYLTIEAEPTTQARNSGLDFSVENLVDIVDDVLDGLDRQGTLVGAGSATWEDPAYNQNLAQNTDIDYLDIHIYPINGNYVIDRMDTILQLAETNDKRIVIGESWLYKLSNTELVDPSITYLDIYPRDVYDFWIPLDQKFIEMMVKLSHHIHCDIISLFWMRYFWNYIEYDETTRDLSATERYALVDHGVGPSMLQGTLTATGETYRRLIQESTDVESSDLPIPESCMLFPNYPNPFNPTTRIRFALPTRGAVSLKVFNTRGEEVGSLIDGNLEAGSHEAMLDGSLLPSGIYVYTLTTENAQITQKCLLVK